jgi:hypothetical protein
MGYVLPSSSLYIFDDFPSNHKLGAMGFVPHHICSKGPRKALLKTINSEWNSTAHFKNCKHLLEYQHLLLLGDNSWSKF